MKLKAISKNNERAIEVRREGSKLTAFIDGVERSFELSEPEPGSYLFKSANGVIESFVSRPVPDGPIIVNVDQEEYEIVIHDPKRLRGGSSGTASIDGPANITSAMPGKIVRLIASEGDEVKSGDGILVVEAMKMQNELKSPKDGVVLEIRVSEDERVNSGDILAIVD